MAVDFPPNLDDGELWLPSEIFPDVGVCSRHHRQGSAGLVPGYPSDLGYIEDLVQQLADLRLPLLDRNHYSSTIKPNPKLSSHPEVFVPGRSVARYLPGQPEAKAGFAYGGFRIPATGRASSGTGTGAFLPDPRLFKLGKPVQPQVDEPGRPRLWQRKQSHGPNRSIPPVRPRGSRMGCDPCGGTGVFLPRVAVDNNVSNQQSMVKGGEPQRRQRPSSRNAAARKKRGGGGGGGGGGGVSHRSPSEMCLPQDWAY